ncbi:hypothetical protein ACWEOO_10425 [Kribbella sp. NPDC004138]
MKPRALSGSLASPIAQACLDSGTFKTTSTTTAGAADASLRHAVRANETGAN